MYNRMSKNGKNLFFGKKIAQVWAVTLNIPHSKGTTGKKHFLIHSRADNSQTGKVRVTVLSHNMLPLM